MTGCFFYFHAIVPNFSCSRIFYEVNLHFHMIFTSIWIYFQWDTKLRDMRFKKIHVSVCFRERPISMLEILLHIWQLLQVIGWNGLSAIATLISSFAALIVAVDILQKRRDLPQLPPKYISSNSTRRPRRRRRNRKRAA